MLSTLNFSLQSIFYLFGSLSAGLFFYSFLNDFDNSSLFLMTSLINIFIIFLIKKFESKLKINLYSVLTYILIIWIIIIIISILPFLVLSQEYSINEVIFLGTSLATTTGFTLDNISIENNVSLKLWRSIVQFTGAVFSLLTYLMLVLLFYNRNKTIFFNKLNIAFFLIFAVSYIFLYLIILSLINNNYLENLYISAAIFSTGGLINKDGHILEYGLSNQLFLFTYCCLMILSILFMPLFFLIKNRKLFKKNLKNFFKRNSLVLVFIITTIMALGFYGNLSFLENIFIYLSFITTTGFLPNSMENYLILEQYKSFIFFIILLVVFGTFSGCAGGGLKIDKISLIFIEIREELYKFIYQHNIKGMSIKKRGSNQEELNTIYALIITGALFLVVSTLLHNLNGNGLKEGFLYSLAALTNVGEGLLIATNINKYCEENLYFMLNILMLCGRFENIGYLLIAKKVLFKN